MSSIHKDMTLNDILKIKPSAKALLFDHGLLSENSVLSHETLQEAASQHELSENEIHTLVTLISELT